MEKKKRIITALVSMAWIDLKTLVKTVVVVVTDFYLQEKKNFKNTS